MNTMIPERTPLLIADEINTINRQTGQTLLMSALEIGRRLKEAKTLVRHGEWAKWLAQSVRYSQRSAARLIQLCEEYADSNWSALSNITYTNALILLNVPPEQREDFIAHNDVASMSSRKLKQALGAARTDADAGAAAEAASVQKLDEVLRKIDDLQGVQGTMISTVTALALQVQRLEQRVQDLTLKILPGQTLTPAGAVEPPEEPGAVTLPGASAAAASAEHDTARADAQAYAQTAAPPSSDSAPDSANSVASAPTASGSSRSEPGFKVSGLDNPDPDYYIREGDALYSAYVKAITDAFTKLQQLLKALALKDNAKKERMRKNLKTLMERLGATMNQWPPAVKMR